MKRDFGVIPYTLRAKNPARDSCKSFGSTLEEREGKSDGVGPKKENMNIISIHTLTEVNYIYEQKSETSEEKSFSQKKVLAVLMTGLKKKKIDF